MQSIVLLKVFSRWAIIAYLSLQSVTPETLYTSHASFASGFLSFPSWNSVGSPLIVHTQVYSFLHDAKNAIAITAAADRVISFFILNFKFIVMLANL
jgi:hypothetical protein